MGSRSTFTSKAATSHVLTSKVRSSGVRTPNAVRRRYVVVGLGYFSGSFEERCGGGSHADWPSYLVALDVIVVTKSGKSVASCPHRRSGTKLFHSNRRRQCDGRRHLCARRRSRYGSQWRHGKELWPWWLESQARWILSFDCFAVLAGDLIVAPYARGKTITAVKLVEVGT